MVSYLDAGLGVMVTGGDIYDKTNGPATAVMRGYSNFIYIIHNVSNGNY